MRTLGGVLVAMATLRLVGGCAFAEKAHEHSAHPSARPMTVEELATSAACGPVEVQGVTTDFRQGNCTAGQSRYTIATFQTDEGATAWIDASKEYGGAYLIGPRWVVVSTTDLLTGLQHQIGGRIEGGVEHHQS